MHLKATLLLIFIAVILLLPGVNYIYAQPQPPPESPEGGEPESPTGSLKINLFNPLGDIDTFAELAAAILRAVVIVAIPLTVLFLIWGGFLFVTAQGNEEQIKRAKKAFFWAVIGAMVVVAAWAMAVAITNSIKEL